jgi:signal transduction histidine kinase
MSATDPTEATIVDATGQLSELTRATAALAHEVRNPLSTLRVNLQLLSEEWREAAGVANQRPEEIAAVAHRGAQRLELLVREIDRLSRIFEDFLRFVGGDEPSFLRTDLNVLVRELAAFFEPQAAAASIRLRTELDPAPLICNLDETLVQQALLNLLLNALQAMPDGGEIILRTARRDGRARVEVIDNGPGIPPDVLPRIFEPWFSARPGGTGLGLAIARRIAMRHNGVLTAESQPGAGSRFVVELPLANTEVPGRG